MLIDVINTMINIATKDHPERCDGMDSIVYNFKEKKCIIGVYASILSMPLPPENPSEEEEATINKILYDRLCADITSVSFKIIKDNIDRFSKTPPPNRVVTKEDFFPNIFDGSLSRSNVRKVIEYITGFRFDVMVMVYVLFENVITMTLIYPINGDDMFKTPLSWYINLDENKDILYIEMTTFLM